MTTPSNTWVRRRVPSMTWKWTRNRSPASNDGTRRSCARSRLSITVLMASNAPPRAGEKSVAGTPCPTTRAPSARAAANGSETRRAGQAARYAPLLARAPRAALLQPPLADPRVMPGQQHVWYLPPAIRRRPRVVRVFGPSLQGGAERFLERRVGVAQGARLLSQDRVAHDHRGKLAAGQDVATDRDDVGDE